MLRWRLTMVVTAVTWSGSVAWRMPRKKPRVIMESRVIICFQVASAPPERTHRDRETPHISSLLCSLSENATRIKEPSSKSLCLLSILPGKLALLWPVQAFTFVFLLGCTHWATNIGERTQAL